MKVKKILSAIMAATMLIGTVSIVTAEGSTSSVNPINEVFGTTEILNTGADYSTVYYGGIPWRVLDT